VVDLVLYDGVCGLCNGLVQFILRHDRAARFRFAALQGAFAADLLRRHGRAVEDLDTVYVFARYGQPDQTVLAKGRAILYVLGQLGGLWRLLAPLLGVLPRPILDFAYDRIARRRYRWFGRLDACPLPAPGTRERFLDGAMNG
jgi:predicted DCC family thiol-disulfide oxidoreductase YuxK